MLRIVSLPDQDRAPILAVFGALAVLAWLSLADPLGLGLGSALDHGELFEGASAAEIAARLPLFVAGWVAMTLAMMLASTIPTQQAVAHVISRRGDLSPAITSILFTAGYLTAWSLFGIAAFFGDFSLHKVVEHVSLLSDHDLLIGGVLVLAAGAYQFTELKDRCLTVCRTPMSFVMTRSRVGRKGALAMGVDHGLYCLGCCWPLMLLMFAYASASLAMMSIAALYFFTEKALVRGEAVSRVVGSALVLAGVVLLGTEIVTAALDLGTACAHGSGGGC